MAKVIYSTKIYQIVFGLILGIIIAEFELGLGFLVFVCTLFLYLGRLKVILLLLLLLAGYVYVLHWNDLIQKDTNIRNSEVTQLNATITEDPQLKDYNLELVVKAENMSTNILVTVDKYSDLSKGDQVILSGKLMQPEKSEFYDRILYLKSRKISLEMQNATLIEVVKYQYSPTLMLSAVKTQLSETLNQNLTEPQTTLAKGLIIGDDSNFDKDFKENLKNSGLSHITSVSGYNVGIIFAGILFLTKFINRKLCLIVAIVLMVIFWQFIGANNLPTERATLMLCLITAGMLLGRKINYTFAIGFSTLLILLEYPYYLFNISFQLSLGAMIGILVLTPKIIKILEKYKIKNLLTEIIATTLAVLITTIPISYLTFGQISSLSILTNILVLPVIPILTTLIILSLTLAASKMLLFAQIIFVAVEYLCKFIILVVNIFGSLSFSNISNPRIAMIFFLLISAPIVFLIFKQRNEQ